MPEILSRPDPDGDNGGRLIMSNNGDPKKPSPEIIASPGNKNFFMNHGKSVAKYASEARSTEGRGDYSLADRMIKKHVRSVANKIDSMPNAAAIWKRLGLR